MVVPPVLLTRHRMHAFRQYDTTPERAATIARDATAAAAALRSRHVGCQAWAVHLSQDRRRVVTVETWRDATAFARSGALGDLPDLHPDTALYRWAGTGGAEPTPVTDSTQGVTVIDVFRVWKPVLGAAVAFTLRNGRAFNRQPGCLSTTVLRGTTAGRIATYARWRTVEDFLTAFATVGGARVTSTDDVNATTAHKTRGLVRTDYHTYDLLDADEGDRR